MEYTLNVDQTAGQLLHKLPGEVREEIVRQRQILKSKPLHGEQLKGRHRILPSLHFSFKGTAYRVIYQVFTDAQAVVVRLAGTREGIYKKLERMSR